MKKNKGTSWRYSPKTGRAWLNEGAEQPEEVPEVYSEYESARIVEHPASAQANQIEQLSERVRNLGDSATTELKPDFTLNRQDDFSFAQQKPAGTELPRIEGAQAPSSVFPPAYTLNTQQSVPSSTTQFAPTQQTQPEQPIARPQIPVQPVYRPNIPPVPSTQRIAERLAQQRAEVARPSIPTEPLAAETYVADPAPIAPAPHVPPTVSKPFHPEEYFAAPVAPAPPTAFVPEPAAPVYQFPIQASPVAQPEILPRVQPEPPAPKVTVVEERPASRYSATIQQEAAPVQHELAPVIHEPAPVKTLVAPIEHEAASIQPEPAPLQQVVAPVAQAQTHPAEPVSVQKQPEPIFVAPKAPAEQPKPNNFDPVFSGNLTTQSTTAPTPEPVQSKPQQQQVAKPVPQPEQPKKKPETQLTKHDPQSGITRLLNAVRAALPVVQRLLPLFEGNVAKAVTNLLAPMPTTHSNQSQIAQHPPVDLAPVERGLLELHRQHRELSDNVAAQNQSLQKVEDQLSQVKNATDRNTLEQQELIQEFQSLDGKVGRLTVIIVLLLVLSVAANIFLYFELRGGAH